MIVGNFLARYNIGVIKRKGDKTMKKILTLLLSCVLIVSGAIGLTACGGEKNITVVARTEGSGTREAFDKVVTDGNGNYLQMKDENGKDVRFTTDTASLQDKTGNVMSIVASDKNSIGYISLGSVNETIKVVSVNGVMPSAETVLNGTYKIQRPFVVMTSSTVSLTDVAADFLLYLKSAASQTHAENAGVIYLANPAQRANEGAAEIAVEEYTVKPTLLAGNKIVINGSTSMEQFIKNAMAGYAALYGKSADEIFTLELQSSSVGKTKVLSDKTGNVIGLSSASVKEDGINSFNVCLDAVAVIVNKDNQKVNDLSISQLYDIYTGKTTKFSQLAK